MWRPDDILQEIGAMLTTVQIRKLTSKSRMSCFRLSPLPAYNVQRTDDHPVSLTPARTPHTSLSKSHPTRTMLNHVCTKHHDIHSNRMHVRMPDGLTFDYKTSYAMCRTLSNQFMVYLFNIGDLGVSAIPSSRDSFLPFRSCLRLLSLHNRTPKRCYILQNMHCNQK
jgi:hypothetical protein